MRVILLEDIDMIEEIDMSNQGRTPWDSILVGYMIFIIS